MAPLHIDLGIGPLWYHEPDFGNERIKACGTTPLSGERRLELANAGPTVPRDMNDTPAAALTRGGFDAPSAVNPPRIDAGRFIHLCGGQSAPREAPRHP